MVRPIPSHTWDGIFPALREVPCYTLCTLSSALAVPSAELLDVAPARLASTWCGWVGKLHYTIRCLNTHSHGMAHSCRIAHRRCITHSHSIVQHNRSKMAPSQSLAPSQNPLRNVHSEATSSFLSRAAMWLPSCWTALTWLPGACSSALPRKTLLYVGTNKDSFPGARAYTYIRWYTQNWHQTCFKVASLRVLHPCHCGGWAPRGAPAN